MSWALTIVPQRAQSKRMVLLIILKRWMCGASNGMGGGIHFTDFESMVQKVSHYFTALPAGKVLLLSLNAIIWLRPEVVYLHRNLSLFMAVMDNCTLILETVVFLMHCT